MNRVIVNALLLLSAYSLAVAQEVTSAGLKPLRGEPLTIPGAKVSTERQASDAALKAFTAATMGLSATESFRVDYIVRLGFDVPDFGRKGDSAWQVRVWDLAHGATGLIWVHSANGNTRILISR